MCTCVYGSGAGADNIKQRLVFVGQEAGKLLEIRQMVKRVGVFCYVFLFED